MKHYDIVLDGQIRWRLTEAALADLHGSGMIHRGTCCRLSGNSEWQNLNEHLPLLKYGLVPSLELKSDDSLHRSQTTWHWSSFTTPFRAAISFGILSIGTAFSFYAGTLSAPSKDPTDRFKSLSLDPPPLYRTQLAPMTKSPAPWASIAKNDNGASIDSLPDPIPSQRQVAPRITPGGSTVARMPSGSVYRPTVSAKAFVQPNSKVTRAPNTSMRSPPGTTVNVQPVPKPQVRLDEYIIPLEGWSTINTRYGSFWIKVRDHGPLSITVWVNSDSPRRIEKVKGFERDGTNIAQVYSLAEAKVYFVDRIGVSLGNCVLKVISDS